MKWGKILNILMLILTVALVACNEAALEDVLPTGASTGEDGGRILPGGLTLPGDDENNPDPNATESTAPVRPSGQVSINNDFCLCKENLPFMFRSGSICDATCAGIPNVNPTLVGNTTLGEQLTLDQDFFQGRLINWCQVPLSEEEQTPTCIAEVTQQFGNGNTFTKAITIGNDNNFQVDFDNNELTEGAIYSFRIRASSNLTEAFSDFVQFQVQDNSIPEDFGGKLQIGSAKRYFCLAFTGASANDRDNTFSINFMFDSANDPPVIPNGVTQFLCHDENLGTPDNPLFPRLGEEFAFNIWDKVDRRHFVNNPDDPDNTLNETDINLYVKKRLKEKFNQTLTSEGLFNPLESRIYPGIANDTQDQIIGFKLQSFVDPDDPDFPACPTEVDLQRPQSDENFDPLYNVLSEFIGATEALYMALRTPRQIDPITSNPVDNILFINQTQLEKIWFYRNDSNQPTYLDPSDANFKNIVKAETLFFYWPANEAAPTIQSAGQELYKVQTRDEIQAEINGTTISNQGAAPPADKRIGCIPKTD